jgi:hypothetical protein
MTKDGQVTPDGYAVNTSYPVNGPHPASVTPFNLTGLGGSRTVTFLKSFSGTPSYMHEPLASLRNG